MPRNGSGTYTLPAGNPVVTGTIISSTVHNNTMSDIATALTASLAKNGETVVTGSIDYNGNALILDVDGDSKMEVSTDDRWDLTLGGSLKISVTAAQAAIIDALAKLAVTDGNFIVGNGTTFVAESGSTARQSLGVDLTTKGTILVGNGTAPAAFPAGKDDQMIVYDSTQATGLRAIDIPGTEDGQQVFTSSGTFTVPAGVTAAYVICVGGGAGSGNASNNVGTISASGGGGAGELSISLVTGLTPSSGITVTVGAGGSAGSAGGNTSFGSSVIANGGSPSSNASNGTSSGGVGGTGGTGDIKVIGQPGGNGYADGSLSSLSGEGGNTQYGSGGRSKTTVSDGEAGRGYGAGASGAVASSGSGTQNGAAGTAGIVIVRYVVREV